MNNILTFRKARFADIDAIMSIINNAKILLKNQDSGQWQAIEPSYQSILKDIQTKSYYVAIKNQLIVGGLSLLNHELAYNHLLSGLWINNNPYLVVHRLAVDTSFHHQGIGFFMLESVKLIARKKGIDSIRIDTHEKNIPMIRLLIKCGYRFCGRCWLPEAGERIVFQHTL